MPSFSKQSKAILATCHPDLQILFNTVILTFDCSIICGHRSQKDQEIAFKTGKSKLKFPNSKHNSNPSWAVDAAPSPIDWENLHRFHWFGGYVLGIADMLYKQGKMTHRVKWGGDWDRDMDLGDEKGLRDFPHFELISS